MGLNDGLIEGDILGAQGTSAQVVEDWIKGGRPLYITTFDSIFTDWSVHGPHPP